MMGQCSLWMMVQWGLKDGGPKFSLIFVHDISLHSCALVGKAERFCGFSRNYLILDNGNFLRHST